MEREAIFRDNLLFFMGWYRKVLNKGIKKLTAVEKKESKRQERGSNIQQWSTFKVTVHRLCVMVGVKALDITGTDWLM